MRRSPFFLNKWSLISLMVTFKFFVVFTVAKAMEEDRRPASASDLAKEADLARLAKTKTYQGGMDEDDLRVQAQLPSPMRRMKSSSESQENQNFEEVEQE